MKLPTEQYLCSFKCPFCSDRVEVTTEVQSDGWTKVHGFCDGQTAAICGIGFEIGVFGAGFSQAEIKQTIVEMVGIRFIN